MRLLAPFVFLGLVLSGCDDPTALKDSFTELDFTIDTKWEDFVMPATEIEFLDGEESIELNKGETHTYSYVISPRGATDNSLTWTSSDESVAKVENGVLTAMGAGETTIIVDSLESTFTATELSVKVNVPLTNFTLDVPARLEWNEKYEFEVSYEPIDTTYPNLTYQIVDASPEGVASVDEDGAVSTYGSNGTATLRVFSEFLGESSAKDYPLVIETIPVTNITLSGPNEVEINKNISVEASVSPENASDLVKKGVKFYSRTPEIATVDEVTGVVTGVSAGDARIYAKVGDFESSDSVVNVFEVHATSVNLTNDPITLANHGDYSLTEQLAWTVETDRAGYTNPSKATISFASSDESVATVNNDGLISAVGPGNANISIIISQVGRADVTDNINVNVDFVSTALSISGGTSFYNDETLTLTATLVPANVTDDTINWTIAPEGVATLSATSGSSVTLSAADEDATGTVTVTATNVNGASNSVTVNVNERNAEFAYGQRYIVGNNLFNTGESVHKDGKDSWGSVKYAYHFTNRVNDTSSLEEYKGTIKFVSGDEFRYFIGSEYWVPVWEDFDEGASRGYHIEQGGAFESGDMHLASDSDPQCNIVVDNTGWYDLYAKAYKNEDGSIWDALYITKVPHMSAELSELTMGVDDTYQIVLHDYIGQVSYGVTSSTPIEVSDTGLITAKAVGDSTVVIHDARMDEVLINVHVRDEAAGVSRTIYLNANNKLDAGSPAIPFVHSWKQGEGGTPAATSKMSKVAGQNIVYEVAIPTDHNYVVIANSKQENFDWAEINSQTIDLALESGKDMFKPTNMVDGKYEGVWSLFDSSTVYEADIEPPYIQYEKAGGWAFAQLVEDPDNNAQYKYDNNLELEAGAEFVICVSSSDWRHYENFNETYSTDKIVQGTTDPQNLKASVAGTYNFYVKKNASDDEGKNVFITYTSSVSGYTVSFDANGGSNTMADIPNQSGNYILPGSGFTAPSGKEFEGWKANNAGDLLDVGDTYAVTEDVTFYAQWKDETVTPNIVTLYLTANWGGFESPKAYVFNSSTDASKAAWPGEDMTYVGVNDDNDTIFSYTVDISSYDRIIFTNGGEGDANETLSIDISSAVDGSAFYFSGRISGENSKIECGTWNYTDGALTSKQIVYISNGEYWSVTKVYIFNSSTHDSQVGWPGESTKWVGQNEYGQDVYRVLIDTTSYDSFILNGSKDYSDKQTVDIALSSLTGENNAFFLTGSTDGSGHYEVGQWKYNPAA